MWTEGGTARQMRAALRSALPPRAFLKRDRGGALFITNAPALDPALREIPGFLIERRGALWALVPDESWARRVERRAPEELDELSRQLSRFRGRTPGRENLRLFAQGAKLLDAAAVSRAQWAAYDRAVRNRAAVALRGGDGGALFACALLCARIQRKIENGDD